MTFGNRDIVQWTFNDNAGQPGDTVGVLVDFIDRSGEEVHGAAADILDWVVDGDVGSIIFYRPHAK